MDVSAGMVAEARRKAPELRVEVADARRLDVPDGAFELVTMNNVMRLSTAGGGRLCRLKRRLRSTPERLDRDAQQGSGGTMSGYPPGPGTAIVARRRGAR